MSFKNICSKADVRVFKIRYFKFFKYVQFPVEYSYDFLILTFQYKYTPTYMQKTKYYITKDHISWITQHVTTINQFTILDKTLRGFFFF